MSNLLKVQIAKGINTLAFWVPVIYVYYLSIGYSATQIFTLLGVLQMLIVLLEYPTGVIGDIYGAKKSVILGFFFLFISFLGIAILGSVPAVFSYITLIVLAAGISFISGSDVSLLYEVSSDFKKDNATANQIASVFQLVGLVIGGLVGAIDLRLPFILTAITSIVAIFILLTVKVEQKESEKSGNLLATALSGIKNSFDIKIALPMFLSSAIMMYILSEKWILPPVIERAGAPIAMFGILSSAVFSTRIISASLYKKYGNQNYTLLIFALILSSLLVSINYVAILGLALVYFISGYILNQSDVEINDHVNPSTRASVLSFRNLLARLFNAPYLWIIGIMSGFMEFPHVNLVMVGILAVVILLVYVSYRVRLRYV